MQVYHGHRGPVVALAFLGPLVFSGSHDGIVRMWDSATGKTLQKFKGHEKEVSAVCVHGAILHSASWDGVIREWNIEVRPPLWICVVVAWDGGKRECSP